MELLSHKPEFIRGYFKSTIHLNVNSYEILAAFQMMWALYS